MDPIHPISPRPPAVLPVAPPRAGRVARDPRHGSPGHSQDRFTRGDEQQGDEQEDAEQQREREQQQHEHGHEAPRDDTSLRAQQAPPGSDRSAAAEGLPPRTEDEPPRIDVRV